MSEIEERWEGFGARSVLDGDSLSGGRSRAEVGEVAALSDGRDVLCSERWRLIGLAGHWSDPLSARFKEGPGERGVKAGDGEGDRDGGW